MGNRKENYIRGFLELTEIKNNLLNDNDFGFTTYDANEISNISSDETSQIVDELDSMYETIMNLLNNLKDERNNKDYIHWPYKKRKNQIDEVIDQLSVSKRIIEDILAKEEQH